MNNNHKVLYTACDLFLFVGITCTVLTNISKTKVPKFLSLLVNYDGLLSVYPTILFILFGITILLFEKRYREITLLIVLGLFFILCNVIITAHGLFLIIDSITEYDIEMISSTARRISLNIISKAIPLSNMKNTFFCSEMLYAVYQGAINYKDIIFSSLLIYSIYKDRGDKFYELFCMGIVTTLVVEFLYEIVELPALFGFKDAEQMLISINPHLYDIGTMHGWWPLLLWPGQLRGTFAEPSFFSYYLGFVISVLIFLLLDKHNFIAGLALLFFSICAFLTNARSGIFLFVGVIVLNIFLQFLCRKNYRNILLLLVLVGLSFCLSYTYDLYNRTQADSIVNEEHSSQVLNSIKSVTDPSARSNKSRYGYIKTSAQIGVEHPFLGVGSNYMGGYLAEKMESSHDLSGEMKNWIDTQNTTGKLNNTFPNLNEYTTAFASGGICGLMMSIALIIVICFKYIMFFFQNGFKAFDNKSIMIISMLSVIVAWGINNTFMINYLYVFVLSLCMWDIRRITSSF